MIFFMIHLVCIFLMYLLLICKSLYEMSDKLLCYPILTQSWSIIVIFDNWNNQKGTPSLACVVFSVFPNILNIVSLTYRLQPLKPDFTKTEFARKLILIQQTELNSCKHMEPTTGTEMAVA